MITREEAIHRLDQITKEILDLRKAFEDGWNQESAPNSTQAFLDKCGGWEDARGPEEIIDEIYSARTHSNRGETIFKSKGQQ